MYSPKIREELIAEVYQAAKRAGVAMTTWVNQAVKRALSENGNDQETNDGKEESKI